MTRIEEFQTRVAEQGKAVLGYTADIVEWSAKKNIDVAKDVAGFTVDQLRLPTKAKDFAHYRESVMGAYGDFGGVLKSHGKDYADKLRERPTGVRDLFRPKKEAAKKGTVRKAPAKKKAKVARKTAAKKKAPVAKKPTPVVKKAEPVVEKAEAAV